MPHDDTTAPAQTQRLATWPLWLLALPAGVAIWSGWVGLGEMTGFGPVTLLPGISDFQINTAVTLPIGMEAYAAYALRAWLSGRLPARAERFARRSAIGALALGAAGQAFYHLLASSGVKTAPWPLTVFVSVLPVLVLGMGAALAHLINTTPDDTPAAPRVEAPQAVESDKAAENIPARIPATPEPSTSAHVPEPVNDAHPNGTPMNGNATVHPPTQALAYPEPEPKRPAAVARPQDAAADLREKAKLVACPTCGAGPKRVCRSPGGDRYKKLHAERWRALGLTPPERPSAPSVLLPAEDPWEQESEPVGAARG